MKILIYLTGGVHWLGGVQYTKNLLNALALLPVSERPEIVLHVGKKGKEFAKDFSHHPNVTIDGPIRAPFGFNKLRDVLRRMRRRVFGSETSKILLHSDECTVAFPVKGPKVFGPARKVYWVPDFQYKHFPQYFDESECRVRDDVYDQMFAEEGILVLSSEAVKRDFLQFFPKYQDKAIRILRFCTIIEDADYELDPTQVCDGFGLPDKFVYLPNQMWQHKGFETVFEALSLLRKQGIVLPLVCTGSSQDYRNGEYFQGVMELVRANELDSQLYMLGMLPRQTQIQIFRRAAIILQPSLFEGWSTSVEDARALGKPIVLSDIDVHREQNPPDAVYFIRGNAEDLARKLKLLWPDLCSGPNRLLEKRARKLAVSRGENYARVFMKIMAEANALKSYKHLSKEELWIEESRITALHHLLHESLLNEYFGPYYSKMLRKRREKIHPVGIVEIRNVKSTTGQIFNVNLGDRLGCDLYYGVFNEQADCELFMNLIEPGDVVVDVGANMGVYTLNSALKAGCDGKIIAFEPDARSYKLLETNLAQNKVAASVLLKSCCLGDYNGNVSFFEATEPCLSGIVDTTRTQVHSICELPIRTLDSVLADIGVDNVALIKIDVEGAEHNVVAGALGVLEGSDAILMVEISPKNLNDQRAQDLQSCLKKLEISLDYQAFRISRDASKLIEYETVEEIFTSTQGIVGGNYFLARRTHGKNTLVVNKFDSIAEKLQLQGLFFKSRFVGRLSKEDVDFLWYAERERGLLAQHQVSLAYKRIAELTVDSTC